MYHYVDVMSVFGQGGSQKEPGRDPDGSDHLRTFRAAAPHYPLAGSCGPVREAVVGEGAVSRTPACIRAGLVRHSALA
jgi:hypothetical protein